jgi:hypothetical protein
MQLIVKFLMCFASSSWCKCFIGSCTCSLYGANELFDMVVGMRIIIVDQQFSLVFDVCGSQALYNLLEVWISTSILFH